MREMPPEALEQVAAYFQVLAEPTRLRILNLLRGGEKNVGDLAQQCGYTAATFPGICR
jgi:DNA-binding transcriptional ArsR family regulator